MAIPTSDQLRTLNLAYRKMQKDFRVFAQDLFRTSSSIVSDSNGYLLLPTEAMSVELIIDPTDANKQWYKMNKSLLNWQTGWYHDGIDTTSGKRRIMVRDVGSAKVGATFTVHYTKEYPDLVNTSDTPLPFVSKAYLDMITTLQAYYYYTELGKEKEQDAKTKFQEYQTMLTEARKDFLDTQATYGQSSHADAGFKNRFPIFFPSS